MARVGLVINLIAVGLTTIVTYVLLPLALGVDPGAVPAWAQ